MDIKSVIKHHIVTEMMHKLDPNVLSDEEPLIEGGIIDSMNLIRLVAFIEEKFGIKVTEEELDIENFRTVKALVSFVSRKVAATPIK